MADSKAPKDTEATTQETAEKPATKVAADERATKVAADKGATKEEGATKVTAASTTDKAGSAKGKAASTTDEAASTKGKTAATKDKAAKDKPATTRPAKKGVAAPGSRRWVPPTFITVGLLGVAWLVTFYIAGQDVPLMNKLGNYNVLIGMGLMASSFGIATLWK